MIQIKRENLMLIMCAAHAACRGNQQRSILQKQLVNIYLAICQTLLAKAFFFRK